MKTLTVSKMLIFLSLLLSSSMTDSDYGEGSGLEMVHISDVLDYLGKINVKIYDEGRTPRLGTCFSLNLLAPLAKFMRSDKSSDVVS